MDKSPWHRERLKGIDVASISEADLTSLPTMTKGDVMSHWDEIVTDKRLSLKGANDHITAKLRSPDTDYYYQGDYEIFATGAPLAPEVYSSGAGKNLSKSPAQHFAIKCAMNHRKT